ncbi:MAG: S8 family serine peptidase [Phycisphaerae bacterium]
MSRSTSACFLAVLALAVTRAGGADDLVFYSGGQAHPLVQSSTELFVEMDRGVAAAARVRLAADPHCTVKSIPWAPGATRFCIAEVDQADLARRKSLRSMPGVQSIRPVYRFAGSRSPMLSSGNIVVQLQASLTAAQRTRFFDEYKVALVNVLDGENGIYTVRPKGGDEADEVRSAAAMYLDDRTTFAHPDFIVRAQTKQILSQFNDEFFNQQWHLNNTGQGGGTIGADINIADAWRITFGEDVLVGIFDDSVDVSHEDLSPNYIFRGHDAALATETPTAPDPRNILDRHGTAVLGLAVADANDSGVVGVAPSAQFTASRGLNDVVTLGQFASAFVFARQQNVAVHVNSWGLVGVKNSQADVLVSTIQSAFKDGRDNLGMVIVFASGNEAALLGFDDDLSTLPEVIGVGASNANDVLASYSNFGLDIDVLAPSGDDFLPGIVTTDNTDEAGFVSPGFNDGGQFDDGFGIRPDLPDPNYTEHFSGTSASCPIAAGTAALIVSVNQGLTASQVRTILEQTSEPIEPANAGYHPITERSVTHGYGRINAGAAVTAALESRDNGGFAWPDRLRSVRITSTTLSWTLGDDIREIDADDNPDTPPERVGEVTTGTLVVESATPFGATNAFVPADGVSYSVGQQVVAGIEAVHNSPDTVFALPGVSGTRFYALFPVNAIGRYGFGVTIDTNGNVEGIGISAGDDDGVSTGPESTSLPRVSINVSPLSGTSPLDVQFRGNALSDNPVESTLWDFDDGENSTRASTTHRYVVAGAETQRFFPVFSVTDEFGNVGSRSVAIDVTGEASVGGPVSGDIRIRVRLPGSVGSDVDSGESPFSVDLSITGTPAGDIDSIFWDLGDGATAETISVPHIYVNNSDSPRTLPISVEVQSVSTGGLLVKQIATRFITVEPNPNPPADGGEDGDNGNGDGADGAGATSGAGQTDLCGAGLAMVFAGMILLTLVKRRVF